MAKMSARVPVHTAVHCGKNFYSYKYVYRVFLVEIALFGKKITRIFVNFYLQLLIHSWNISIMRKDRAATCTFLRFTHTEVYSYSQNHSNIPQGGVKMNFDWCITYSTQKKI